MFAVLTTGYGKSFCNVVLSIVFDRLLGTDDYVVFVIKLLTAIIKDQVRYALKNFTFLFRCTVDYFRKTEIKQLLNGP